VGTAILGLAALAAVAVAGVGLYKISQSVADNEINPSVEVDEEKTSDKPICWEWSLYSPICALIKDACTCVEIGSTSYDASGTGVLAERSGTDYTTPFPAGEAPCRCYVRLKQEYEWIKSNTPLWPGKNLQTLKNTAGSINGNLKRVLDYLPTDRGEMRQLSLEVIQAVDAVYKQTSLW
jgi:hypothetical protein